MNLSRKQPLYAGLILLVTAGLAQAAPEKSRSTNMPQATGSSIEERIVIDKVWSAVSVGFSLLTHGDRQYIAYYNADRRTVVGMRDLKDDAFTLHVLPSRSDDPPTRRTSSTVQGWDSHNYWTMTVDSAGHLHLSGNMHANPLTYFRSTQPGDVTTLVQVDEMVGRNERRATYPKFMTGPDGRLIFHYRDGGSGNGNEIYNVYDVKTKAWTRFFDQPLVHGGGKANAYQRGPQRGPDGNYHLLWMWRDTPDVATNHDLSYARSQDLKNWETAGGEPLDLPITMQDRGTIIDPVPPGGGLHNSNHHFTFDRQHRVVVTYYKHDPDGNTQAYAARFEDGGWKIQQLSDWRGKHIFKGGGSGPSTFGTSLGLGRPRQHGDDQLALPFNHWKAGSGMLVFDEATLEPRGVVPEPQRFPAGLRGVNSDFPGMRVKWAGDRGKSPDPGSFYVLRWETLGPNRDRPRDKPWPDNSELVLYKIKR